MPLPQILAKLPCFPDAILSSAAEFSDYFLSFLPFASRQPVMRLWGRNAFSDLQKRITMIPNSVILFGGRCYHGFRRRK
jgi:hypothetical protein